MLPSPTSDVPLLTGFLDVLAFSKHDLALGLFQMLPPLPRYALSPEIGMVHCLPISSLQYKEKKAQLSF